MIRTILKKAGLLVYARYLREKYLPSKSQIREKNSIDKRKSFYGQFIKSNDLCFDVGANIGNRTKVFLALGAKVVAVEPQSDCVKMLTLRFKNRITIVQKALGQKDGDGVIYIGESSAISSLSKDWISAVASARFKGKKWNTEQKVDITTLDKLISTYGRPAFCKIDVEGYEQEVLKGLTSRIPFLSFEYAVPERINEITNCLNELDRVGQYVCNYTIGEKMEFKLADWVSREELISYVKLVAAKQTFGDIYIHFVN